MPRKATRTGLGRHHRVGWLAMFATWAYAGCTDRGGGGPGLEIRVQPLQFDSVLKVCYDIAVYDGIGTLLWQAGVPNLNWDQGDPTTICSDEFGTGSGGDIQYIGDCDPTFNPNAIAITIDGIYTINGRLEDDVDWLPTCTVADPCFQYVECLPDGNVLVEFNILVMRSANQGFFDIAVKFDDVFCSAKVDCTYDAAGTEPIMAVHHDGLERQTAVVGLACTAGPDTTEEDIASVLHVNDVRIACGDIQSDEPAALVWTCERDNPTYYGYYLHEPASGPEYGGLQVTRAPGPGPYSQDVLAMGTLPPGFDAGVVMRVLADTTSPREALMVYVRRHANPSVDGPWDRLATGLAKRDGGPWEFSSIGDSAGFDIVVPRAWDGKHLLSVTTTDALMPVGSRVVTYRVANPPGSRVLSPPTIHALPERVSGCGRFQMLDGWFIGECFREDDPGGGAVPWFEGVLWVAKADDPANSAVLRVPSDEPHFRVSLAELGGVQVEPDALVIGATARFQWSMPPGFVPPEPGDRFADSQTIAVVFRCPDFILPGCVADQAAPVVDPYRPHETAVKIRAVTEVRGLADSFLFGRFLFDTGVQETRAAVIELRDGGPSSYWFEWVDAGGAPINDVRVMGIFPQSRVVYGHFGPEDASPLDGSGPWPQETFVARLPSQSEEVIEVVALPLPAGTEPRVFLGRAGPESQRRLLMKTGRVSPDTGLPIEELVELRLRDSFLGVDRFTYLGPETWFGPDATDDLPWDFDWVTEFQSRARWLEGRTYDHFTANCLQTFGAVDAVLGRDPLIIDPEVDRDIESPPLAGIGAVWTAYADPLPDPGWLESDPPRSYTLIDPSIDPGYRWHGGDVVLGIPPNPRPAEIDPVLHNYGVYRGVEELDCGSGSCNKLYWNVAVGFDPTVADCTLYFDATVSAASTLENGQLPAGQWWPWLEATVPLTGPGGGLVCTQHPMGSPEYPAMAYAVDDSTQGCYRYDGASVTEAEMCEEAGYWLGYREWAP